jgi:mannose-6-phosphate isomerase-like protein (cupin superfamily)
VLEPGSTVTSPRGTVVEILDNRPERFALRRVLPPGTGKGASHRHLDSIERFTVLEGEATGSVDGRERLLRADDVLEVPRGSPHVHPHTAAGVIATIEHVVEPRTRFVLVYFASWLGWLREGRVDRQEEPTLLEIMSIIDKGGGGSWVTGPPIAVQRLMARVLARVAAARGITATVPPGA